MSFGTTLNLLLIKPYFSELIYASILILLFFIPLIYIFKEDRVDLLDQSKLGHSAQRFYIISLILFCLILGIYVYSQPISLSTRSTLNGSQSVSSVGILFKIGMTLCPAIAFASFTLFKDSFLNRLLILFCFSISLYIAIVFLTKQPLAPYLILGIALFLKDKLSARFISILLFAYILYEVLSLIYFSRSAQETDMISLLRSVVFRAPLIQEMVAIIRQENVGLFLSFKDVLNYTTESVFGFDSRFIGIAPGYAGLYYLNYGLLYGLTFSYIFAYITAQILKYISSPSLIERIAYFLISCEMVIFFIDGNPAFYTSTTNNLLFYAIGIITLLILVTKSIRFFVAKPISKI